ncbi:MAG TPA: glycosyltransferase [Thermoanaerobaculia bacterium]|nr:glycosyltransferase [Thermoanaerobaculia bacterium]
MRRNLLLAHALANSRLEPVILSISGKGEAGAFPLPPRADRLILPALKKSIGGKYEPASLDLPMSEVIAIRSAILEAGLSAFDPDLLIVDNVPRGAKRELDPVLAALKARGRARIVLGLRDVLDDPEIVAAEWRRADNHEVIRRYYDAVWIYGDPRIADLAHDYEFEASTIEKMTFTGYFDQRRRLEYVSRDDSRSLDELALPPGKVALCMLGGGQDGAPLAEAFLQASLPDGWNAVVMAGPYLPREASRALHHRAEHDPRFRVVDFIPEPVLLLSLADRVISMGGYNSVSEILCFEKSALIIPRIEPRREQLIRAERLAALRLLEMLHPNDLNGAALTAWLSSDERPRSSIRDIVDLDGLETLAELAEELVTGTTSNAIPPFLRAPRHKVSSQTPAGQESREGDHLREAAGSGSNGTLAILVKRFPRLSETFVLNEVLELRRQGVSLRLFAMLDPEEAQKQPEAEAMRPEVFFLRAAGAGATDRLRRVGELAKVALSHPFGFIRALGLVSAGGTSPWRHLLDAVVLVRQLRASGCRHIHAHFAHGPASVAHLASAISGIPFSFTAHAKDLFTTPPGAVARRAHDARFALTCTESSAQHMRNMLAPEERRKVAAYPHGIDLARFGSVVRQPADGRILAVGRLVPKKGFDRLLHALALLAERGIAFDCVILGDGPQKEALQSLSRDLGLETRVTFEKGRPQAELLACYAEASVFVMSSVVTSAGDRDGVPNVLMEAMACGIPVVASDISGIPELVTDRHDGLLVPSGDHEAIADALQELLTNSARAHRIGEAGRRTVIAKRGLREAVQPLAALFETTLTRTAREERPLALARTDRWRVTRPRIRRIESVKD